MKKTYIKPETKTFPINCKVQLMAGSPPLSNDVYDDEEVI